MVECHGLGRERHCEAWVSGDTNETSSAYSASRRITESGSDKVDCTAPLIIGLEYTESKAGASLPL